MFGSREIKKAAVFYGAKKALKLSAIDCKAVFRMLGQISFRFYFCYFCEKPLLLLRRFNRPALLPATYPAAVLRSSLFFKRLTQSIV
jgi:hypothetical protein